MGLVSIKCDLVQRIFVVRDFRVWKMPSDIISFAVSTGLGVSVLAGILSGVCYVLAHGKHKNSNRKLTKEWYCDVCGIYLRSIERILGGDEAVTCIKCRGRVCRRKCSSLNEQRSGWTCKNCLRPPESWFRGILNAIHPAKKVEIEVNMQSEPLDEVDEDLEELKKKGKEQVQDFLEKLVNGMLGQNVDDASVTKTYNDELYDSIFKKYHADLSNALTVLGTSLHNSISNLPLTGQSPCTAHAALKQLIERLLKEVVNLPSLQKTQENSALSSDLNNKTYEDLLATAILNKVISSSQNTLPSSSAASVSSRPTSSLGRRDDKEYFFGEETLESKWKTADLESTSISSLEEWIQSDSSFGTRKYVDRLTLTIKQDIEEVSSTDSENEDDDNDDKEYFHQKSLLSDDEPNWFLQKRQFQGTASPVPVPMLVPSPAIEAKVLIGDTEADETSDLSDVGSDFEETGKTPGTHGLLVEAKTIIGGKNPAVQNGGSESESSADSGVKEVDRDRFEYDDSDFVQRTDITVDDDNVEDASLLSVYSNIEQEAEYTERYASLPRTIMKTPTPPARPSLQKEMYPDGAKITQATVNHTHEKESDEEDENILERQFSGTYSRREKEKWKHAIEMKNNPYSKENIENRIKRSNSAVSSLFGPDYYAKLASSPTGEKKKSQKDRNNDQNTMYNSDEGAMMKETTNHAFYSSEEDFLVPKANEVPKAKIHRLNSSAFSYSSEDLPSEPSSANLERSKMSKPYAFSSFEDLLSSEEYEQPLPKKKDNTLISKIYQQQHVRNYALSNRDYIPDSGPFKETASFENNLSDDNNRAKQLNKKITVMEQNAAPEKIHLEPLSIVKSLDSSEEFKHDRNITTSDQEISEIAKKKIVHNFLDQIASGQPKPNPSRRNIIEDFPETAEDEEKILSVKELRRKFEKDQGKSKVVSSLTARNLSKQMKTTWKN
ncbi:uncharacterized protein isoform X5 [Leptinotarsa decemlineata]|uniref:uncharacterized protein isoform X5 n=1 Tax=Leptinotarsa decemlineata TaxID=7539 RepID=UPI003D30B4B0